MNEPKTDKNAASEGTGASPCSASLAQVEIRAKQLQHSVECGQCDPEAAAQEIMVMALAATMPNKAISKGEV